MSLDTPGERVSADDDPPDPFPGRPVSPAALRLITEDLESGGDLSGPEALEHVWHGLCAARLLGLRLAASGLARLQVNAESVEHQLAADFAGTAAFARRRLTLPTPATSAPLAPTEVGEAVEALVEFSAAARRRMLASARLAAEWHDERVLRHDSLVMGELGAAWLGNRRSYRVDR
ncbi:hypothetical protein [Saccharothrix obliqua]|uniref:hypothetical protein n=1 Tax=Saccharothrix obliqua TaxID=2861747 RepID=UPI001C5CE601|nr:hypothetical protein [Saccharothrix obliqua]MBW4720197.1 hypothetical protein [Saccharothrix obliqua]